ncbi:MAG: cytochrome P450 [Gammaproteobacteria bacterium]
MPQGKDAPECPNGFHPFRWEDAADPFDKLRELRATCPVSTVRFGPLPPIKLFTKFADATEIYRDWEAFGNIGTTVNKAEHAATPVADRAIIASDPPWHGAMRRFALLALSPGSIDAHVPSIRAYAVERTAALPRNTVFDLMEIWSAPIPSVATARVLGLPDEDALEFRAWVHGGVEHLARQVSPSSPDFVWIDRFDQPLSGSMFPESADYVGRWVRARRADPAGRTDDVLGRMLDYVDGETGIRFSDEQAIAQLVTIIAAGNDTTASLIGNLVFRMLTVPDLWETLRRNRAKIAAAIEESLRLDPPQQMFPRLCLKDREVGAVPVKAGEVIIISMASGNRDESVYGPDADEFNMDRTYPNPRHLSMGRGIHTCIGAYLARKVTQASIEALLDAVPAMSLAPGYEYEKVIYHHFRGPERLLVTIPESPPA